MQVLISAVSSVLPLPAAPHSVLTLWMVAEAGGIKMQKDRKTHRRTGAVQRGEGYLTGELLCCRTSIRQEILSTALVSCGCRPRSLTRTLPNRNAPNYAVQKTGCTGTRRTWVVRPENQARALALGQRRALRAGRALNFRCTCRVPSQIQAKPASAQDICYALDSAGDETPGLEGGRRDIPSGLLAP